MDYHVGPIGVEPPKLWCFPARPLVCVLAIIGICRSMGSFIETPTFETGVFIAILVFLDVILLVGAAHNNEKYLNWSLKVLLVGMVFAVLQLLIFPVVAASAAASGVLEHGYETAEKVMKLVFGGNHDMFVNGMAIGYLAEFVSIYLIGAQTLKYVLINRLWEYAKVTEGIL